MRGWLATWGATLPSRRRGAWWTTVRDWVGAALPRPCKRDWRAPRPVCRGSRRRSPSSTQQQQIAVDDRGPHESGAAAGAAQGRGDHQRVGVARRRAWCGGRSGIGGKSAACSDLRHPVQTAAELRAGAGDQMRAGNARLQAISIQLAWNWVRWQPQSALTQWYQAQFGKGKRARRDRDRRRGPQAGDCLMAVCDDRRRPCGRDCESRVRRSDGSHARGEYDSRRVAHAATATKEVPSHSYSPGLRLHSLWGPRAGRASSDRRRATGSWTQTHRRTRVSRRLVRARLCWCAAPTARTAHRARGLHGALYRAIHD